MQQPYSCLMFPKGYDIFYPSSLGQYSVTSGKLTIEKGLESLLMLSGLWNQAATY